MTTHEAPAPTGKAPASHGLAGTVPAEPGNLGYAVYQNDEDRSVFHILEQWTTTQDADRAR